MIVISSSVIVYGNVTYAGASIQRDLSPSEAKSRQSISSILDLIHKCKLQAEKVYTKDWTEYRLNRWSKV